MRAGLKLTDDMVERNDVASFEVVEALPDRGVFVGIELDPMVEGCQNVSAGW